VLKGWGKADPREIPCNSIAFAHTSGAVDGTDRIWPGLVKDPTGILMVLNGIPDPNLTLSIRALSTARLDRMDAQMAHRNVFGILSITTVITVRL